MIEVSNVTIRAGGFTLPDVSFEIPTGSYGVLMGKTGVGKTTILEAICGLRKVTKGCVRIAGVDVTHWPPADRGLGYVPQDLALFPNLRVEEQLRFAMRLRKVPEKEQQERLGELSALLDIRDLMDRKVVGLSGGEAQRVALGRSLSFRPTALLLDEPLSALDAETHGQTLELLRSIQRQFNLTVLHVTHNASEAEQLADLRIYLTQGAAGTEVTSEQ